MRELPFWNCETFLFGKLRELTPINLSLFKWMQFWFTSIECQKISCQLFIILNILRNFIALPHHIKMNKSFKASFANFKFTIAVIIFSHRFRYFRVFFVGNKVDECAAQICVMIMDELGKWQERAKMKQMTSNNDENRGRTEFIRMFFA